MQNVVGFIFARASFGHRTRAGRHVRHTADRGAPRPYPIYIPRGRRTNNFFSPHPFPFPSSFSFVPLSSPPAGDRPPPPPRWPTWRSARAPLRFLLAHPLPPPQHPLERRRRRRSRDDVTRSRPRTLSPLSSAAAAARWVKFFPEHPPDRGTHIVKYLRK